MIYPFNEILLSKAKEWTVDTCNEMDASENNYAEWKKPNKKRIFFILFHYIKFEKMLTNL